MSIYCQIASNSDCSDDQAIAMLGSIFGKNFIDAFISGSSPANVSAEPGTLAPVLMGGIASIAFSLSIVIASCLLLTALLNSAQDGEAFGSGSSKATIVMRFLFSWLMLLPTPSGYSVIQVILMTFVLWSNGSTNKLYQKSIETALFSTTGLSQPTDATRDIWGLRATAIQALRQIHCVSVLNAEFYNQEPKTNVWLARSATTNANISVPAGWVANVPPDDRVMGTYLYGRYEKAYNKPKVEQGDTSTFTKATFFYAASDKGGKIGTSTSAICGYRTLTIQRFDTQVQNFIDSINNKDDKDLTYQGDLRKAVGLSAEEQKVALRSMVNLNQSIQSKKYNFMIAYLMQLEKWYMDQNIIVHASSNVGENPFKNASIATLDTMVNANIVESNKIVSTLLSTGHSTAFGAALEALSNMLVGKGWTQASSIRQRVLGFQNEMQKANKAEIFTFTNPVLNESVVSGEQGKAVSTATVEAYDAFVAKIITRQDWNIGLEEVGATEGLAQATDAAAAQRSAENYIATNVTWINDLQTTIVYALLHGGNGPGEKYAQQTSNSVNPLSKYNSETDVIANMQKAGEYMMAASVAANALKISVESVYLSGRLMPGFFFEDKKNQVLDAIYHFVSSIAYPILTTLMMACMALGLYMAVIIPSMPTLFFTTAVVAWFIHIIQAMAGLPLWSLMHMIPERTFAGSQTQGYVTIIALFLRPILTLVGLWFGFILSNPILFYVTDAFWGSQLLQFNSTQGNSISAVFFGFVTFAGWMTAYCTLILAVCYMIFGLCSQLPNTVLEWLGSSLNAGNWGESNAHTSIQGISGNTPRGGGGGKEQKRPNSNPGKTEESKDSGGSGGSTAYSGKSPANGLTSMPVSHSLGGGSKGGSGTSGGAGANGTSGGAGASGTSGGAGASGTSGGASASGGAGANGTSGGAGASGSTSASRSSQSYGASGATVVGGGGYSGGTSNIQSSNAATMTTGLNNQKPKGMSFNASVTPPMSSGNTSSKGSKGRAGGKTGNGRKGG